MKFSCVSIALMFFCSLCVDSISGQVSYLDNYLTEYRTLRNSLFQLIGRSDGPRSYNWNSKKQRVQKRFSESKNFFCDPNGPGGRSKIRPNSVHQLRPGDIDIVGAIGDSLTAGNGAMATNILQVLIENKGVSWSIGGQATWRKYLTLPNILKVFNPNLYGYSLSDGLSVYKSSRFNVAEIGAMSRDIPTEAKVLVRRMTNDPRVNVSNDWKLITILIGPNDFCLDFCYQRNPDKAPFNHERDLIATLRILRDNLPRTMVNLVLPPSMKIIRYLRGKPLECESSHHIECPCVFGLKNQYNVPRYFKIMEQWQDVEDKVANMDEFHRDDFTVIAQPFLKNVEFPRKSNGNHDFTYMSLDCFHLSQKGYARASNALWNNMLESYGNKSTNWKDEFINFRCPTEQRPFIVTKQNTS